ncbi:hypothetical protein DENSPDRAFT_555400 [Dentipellis sp. KUC8613]|nr:hypothetical protein DENSPDRAFT_555400 [Dentipellis sp. KUC8613]
MMHDLGRPLRLQWPAAERVSPGSRRLSGIVQAQVVDFEHRCGDVLQRKRRAEPRDHPSRIRHLAGGTISPVEQHEGRQRTHSTTLHDLHQRRRVARPSSLVIFVGILGSDIQPEAFPTEVTDSDETGNDTLALEVAGESFANAVIADQRPSRPRLERQVGVEVQVGIEGEREPIHQSRAIVHGAGESQHAQTAQVYGLGVLYGGGEREVYVRARPAVLIYRLHVERKQFQIWKVAQRGEHLLDIRRGPWDNPDP